MVLGKQSYSERENKKMMRINWTKARPKSDNANTKSYSSISGTQDTWGHAMSSNGLWLCSLQPTWPFSWTTHGCLCWLLTAGGQSSWCL